MSAHFSTSTHKCRIQLVTGGWICVESIRHAVFAISVSDGRLRRRRRRRRRERATGSRLERREAGVRRLRVRDRIAGPRSRPDVPVPSAASRLRTRRTPVSVSPSVT